MQPRCTCSHTSAWHLEIHSMPGCALCPCDDYDAAEPSPNRHECREPGCTWWVIGSSPIAPREITEHYRKAHR